MWFGFVYSHFCDKLAKKQKFIKKMVLCVNANGLTGSQKSAVSTNSRVKLASPTKF